MHSIANSDFSANIFGLKNWSFGKEE